MTAPIMLNTIMVNEGDTIKLPCSVDKLENFFIIWKEGSGILPFGDKPFNGTDARKKQRAVQMETDQLGQCF